MNGKQSKMLRRLGASKAVRRLYRVQPAEVKGRLRRNSGAFMEFCKGFGLVPDAVVFFEKFGAPKLASEAADMLGKRRHV